MGVSASGIYVQNMVDVFDATQLAIDLSLNTHKFALFTNSITPNFDSDVSYSATGEVTGTGYTAGGNTIANPTLTISPAGTMKYDIDDPSWSSSTFSGVRAGQLYADALAGNNLIVLVNFGADYAVTNGVFSVQIPAGGLYTVDWTP